MSGDHLGEFEVLVMAALLRLGDDAYGVSVRREIERHSERSVAIGAIYTTLARLERKGLVRSRMGQPTAVRGGRAKRYYHVTRRGERALARTLRLVKSMVAGTSLDWSAV